MNHERTHSPSDTCRWPLTQHSIECDDRHLVDRSLVDPVAEAAIAERVEADRVVGNLDTFPREYVRYRPHQVDTT